MRIHKAMSLGLFICSFALYGCIDDSSKKNRFQLQQVGSEIYLVDQHTGAVFIKKRERFAEIQKINQSQLSKEALSRPLFVDPIKNLSFFIQTKYKNDSMLYKIEVRPLLNSIDKDSAKISKPTPIDKLWSSYWEKEGNNLSFNFLDQDGFVVARKDIILAGVHRERTTRIVDDNDDVIGFQYDGKLTIPPDDYELIRQASVSYTLVKQNTSKPKPN